MCIRMHSRKFAPHPPFLTLHQIRSIHWKTIFNQSLLVVHITIS
jgi:hypothetical protein